MTARSALSVAATSRTRSRRFCVNTSSTAMPRAAPIRGNEWTMSPIMPVGHARICRDIGAVEQHTRFGRTSTRCPVRRHHMSRSAYRVRRISWRDLAIDQPIEQVPICCLTEGAGELTGACFDPGRDRDRIDARSPAAVVDAREIDTGCGDAFVMT